MRKDMFKVIVERPRVGGRDDRKGRLPKDPSDLPKKQSMKSAHYSRKELNENLEPMKRFLASRLGRPWNDVFSEICEHISVNSTIQKHVRDHVKQMVREDVTFKDGKMYDRRSRYGGDIHELWNDDLYVDPRNGILKKYKGESRYYRYKQPSPERVRDIALKTLNLVLVDGVLYKVQKNKKKSPKYDVEKEYRQVARSVHARRDFETNGAASEFLSRHLTRELFQFEYFRELLNVATAWGQARAREKAALKRKKMEALADSTGSV